ncbi:hypothetical protein ACWG8W_06235 [Citricoccus zhacaiensis]
MKVLDERMAKVQEDLLNKADLTRVDREKFDAQLRGMVEEHAEAKSKMQADQRKLNATQTGRAALEAQLADKSLTGPKRNAVEAALSRAQEDHAEEVARRELQFLKQDSLRAELAEQGVPQAEIDAIVLRGTRGKGTPHPRSYNSYTQMLMKSEDRLDAENSMNEERVNAIFEAGYDVDEEGVRLDAEDARHEKAVAKLKREIAERKFARDATPRGQKEFADRERRKLTRLREARDEALDQTVMNFNPKEREELLKKANSLTLQHAKKDAEYRLRIAELKRFHSTGLSDRKHHELMMNQIRESSKLAGGDPDAAVKAWQKPEKPIHPPVDPMLLSTAVSVHVTESQYDSLQASYEQTDKSQSFNMWMAAKACRNPIELASQESVEDAQGRKLVFGVGEKPGRRQTELQEKRTKILRLSMSVQDKETVKKRAEGLHDAMSSFVSKMVRDQNPVQIQNDRSIENWAMKLAACRSLVDAARK